MDCCYGYYYYWSINCGMADALDEGRTCFLIMPALVGEGT
jgi:hypothetical protein